MSRSWCTSSTRRSRCRNSAAEQHQAQHIGPAANHRSRVRIAGHRGRHIAGVRHADNVRRRLQSIGQAGTWKSLGNRRATLADARAGDWRGADVETFTVAPPLENDCAVAVPEAPVAEARATAEPSTSRPGDSRPLQWRRQCIGTGRCSGGGCRGIAAKTWQKPTPLLNPPSPPDGVAHTHGAIEAVDLRIRSLAGCGGVTAISAVAAGCAVRVAAGSAVPP